jgi:hypothetical protein
MKGYVTQKISVGTWKKNQLLTTDLKIVKIYEVYAKWKSNKQIKVDRDLLYWASTMLLLQEVKKLLLINH